MALATHAFTNIPLEVLVLAKLFSSVPLLVESMKQWSPPQLDNDPALNAHSTLNAHQRH